MLTQPHHDGSALYVSQSAPALGDQVTLWVRVPASSGVTAVHVRVVLDGEPVFTPSAVDSSRSGLSLGGYGVDDVWWQVAVIAHNPVTRYRFYLLRDNDPPLWLTAGGVAEHEVADASDFRLVTYAAPPSWVREAVIYEIFPDRFARSAHAAEHPLPSWATAGNWDTDSVVYQGPETPIQFFGGDLDGIIEHLDHVQSLGVNTIYLRPVFPARSNHRYNATTFDQTDPLLGGDKALYRLAEAVHARGMRLVGDITTNHCGDDHEWFARASADLAAPEREMFLFDPSGGYEAWYGVPSLPKLNWASDLVRERLTAVMLRWLDVYDGWRVDVANMTGRFAATDLTLQIAAGLRQAISAHEPEAMLVGEHTHDCTGDLDADGWHGAMYHVGFTRPLWTWLRSENVDLPDFIGAPGGIPRRDGGNVLRAMRLFAGRISWRSLTHSWQILDSFDTARFRTVTGSRERHLVGAGLQATLPGVPMVCAGSEWGLTGRNGEHARTPMPWERPGDRDEEMFDGYQRLLNLRLVEPALREGGLRWVHAGDDALVFLRETATESLLVSAVRADTEPIVLPLDARLTAVHNAADIAAAGGWVTLPADGPALRIWRVSAQ